jgi:hypothetical protein
MVGLAPLALLVARHSWNIVLHSHVQYWLEIVALVFSGLDLERSFAYCLR